MGYLEARTVALFWMQEVAVVGEKREEAVEKEWEEEGEEVVVEEEDAVEEGAAPVVEVEEAVEEVVEGEAKHMFQVIFFETCQLIHLHLSSTTSKDIFF